LASEIERFQDRLMRELLNAGRKRSRRYILRRGGAHVSRQVADDMKAVVQSSTKGYLYVDPYWALYYHDGRGPIVGKNMIWFKNPKLDPRLNAGRTPNRYRNKRSLTKDQFREARKQGHIIVRSRVAGVRPTPFFSNTGGMTGFRAQAGEIVQREFRKLMKDLIGAENLNARASVSLDLRVS